MEQSLFKRLLRLSSRTRDRVIFVDPETGRASVLMSLGAYESLLDRVEDDMADEFDISEFGEDEFEDDEEIWSSPRDLDPIGVPPEPEIEEPSPKPEQKIPSAAASALEDEEKFYLEPLE